MPPCTLHSCVSPPQHKRMFHQSHHNSGITNPLVSETRPRQAMWPCKKPVHVAASRLNRTELYIFRTVNRQVIELRFYVPLHTKVGHFGDVLPSQYPAVVLKKLNPTEQKQNKTRRNWQKHTKSKPKRKPTVNFKNCSCVCVCVCVQHNCRIRNRAQNSSDIFSLILRTNVIARTLSTGGEGDNCRLVQ